MIFLTRFRHQTQKKPHQGASSLNPFRNGNSIKLNFEVHLIALGVRIRHRGGILGGSVFGTLDDDIDAAPGFGNQLANLLPLRFRFLGLLIGHSFLAVSDIFKCFLKHFHLRNRNLEGSETYVGPSR